MIEGLESLREQISAAAIIADRAKQAFENAQIANTKTDPKERDGQVTAYAIAQAEHLRAQSKLNRLITKYAE